MNYKPVIGLEVHVELKTKSKMFCGCLAEYFGKEPNTHVCPICLGLPGALPVPNKKAIEWCVMIGMALNCKIPLFSKFDRKNYFYPDLPKGYQISQYDQPFCVNGYVILSETKDPKKDRRDSSSRLRRTQNDIGKRIGIRRVHMEEDTAKLVHEFGNQKSILRQAQDKNQKDEGYSLIDFNRSGVPLVEIVTEPDFESAKEVVEYLKKLQQIVRYLDVSNADMEKGEMRLEPNISLYKVSLRGEKRRSNPMGISTAALWPRDDKITVLPDYKVEVKNINSFRFVEKAINYEVERQKQILESGKTPVQETRGWDDQKQITVSQRVKEEAMDYRYFPEADIPPVRWRESQISNLKSQMTELPDNKLERFKKEYGLSNYDAEILTREREIADYFEEAVKVNHELRIKNHGYTDTKTIANWIINKKIDVNEILPNQLVQDILSSMQSATINQKDLEKVVEDIIDKNKKAVEDYKKGKVQVIGFLIGQVKQTVNQPLDTEQVKKAIEKLTKTH